MTDSKSEGADLKTHLNSDTKSDVTCDSNVTGDTKSDETTDLKSWIQDNLTPWSPTIIFIPRNKCEAFWQDYIPYPYTFVTRNWDQKTWEETTAKIRGAIETTHDDKLNIIFQNMSIPPCFQVYAEAPNVRMRIVNFPEDASIVKTCLTGIQLCPISFWEEEQKLFERAIVRIK